jgi:hypothetical protein
MDFATLHDTLPFVKGGETHYLSCSPYPGITLKFPGKHAMDTNPIGGDFVVTVNDKDLKWKQHPFRHHDLFMDLETRYQAYDAEAQTLMADYAKVVFGADPEPIVKGYTHQYPGLMLCPKTFLRAVQCLAVAEHRRYAQYEPKGGGRYLPARFAYGIVNGLWTAGQAGSVQKSGRPGVEMLERQQGIDGMTKLKELAG